MARGRRALRASVSLACSSRIRLPPAVPPESSVTVCPQVVAMADQAPPNVQPAEASDLLSGGKFTLLDVRTPDEYALGSVPGSINIPIKVEDGNGGMVPNPDFLEQVKAKVGTDTPVVCTCAHGRRGGEAARQLAAAGCVQVVNLEGGLAAWSDEKLPHEGEIKRHH